MNRTHTCVWSFYLIRWTYFNLTALRDWHRMAFFLHRGKTEGQIAKRLDRKWTRSTISIHIFDISTPKNSA